MFGSHSLLSSSLNIGIITPKYVLETVITYFDKMSESDKRKNINNVEAFVRQLIGWRSFTRFMYVYYGQKMIKMNKLNHRYRLNKKWYNATTNIEPIDFMIKKVEKYAFLHHIERLMYVGNFALLTQVAPISIYKWFMIVSIDSYEWVMVSNVMGMSQYALTNISMMTRPYFSSSNYIRKMSDFTSNSNTNNWNDIWDALYYNFIDKHYQLIRENYATATAAIYWHKMDSERKKKLKKIAKQYLTELHS
jgi:deoxyribodipyrimidine photolyase-related protein